MVTEWEVGPADPLRLVTSRLVHRPYPHKTTERELFSAALDEAREAGADDALLLTACGEVAEAAIWCVFWWEGDRLCTPALDLGVLPSVARRRIEELAGPLTERRMPRSGLARRSIFLGNALRGVSEVAELDGAPVPWDPATAAVQRRFWDR
jgi:branched-subunit amino acid aminotransferase/4-amino-4-deoxychorismate lyase